MKLTSTWVDQTQSQLNVQVIPDDHPAAKKLSDAFGDHTFFLGMDGLHIVEPTEPADMVSEAGEVVKLASWRDQERTMLQPQEPEVVGVVVVGAKS